MLTKRVKAYSSSGSVVTYRSTNQARRRVTSFQLKRVTNYATPPTITTWKLFLHSTTENCATTTITTYSAYLTVIFSKVFNAASQSLKSK